MSARIERGAGFRSETEERAPGPGGSSSWKHHNRASLGVLRAVEPRKVGHPVLAFPDQQPWANHESGILRTSYRDPSFHPAFRLEQKKSFPTSGLVQHLVRPTQTDNGGSGREGRMNAGKCRYTE